MQGWGSCDPGSTPGAPTNTKVMSQKNNFKIFYALSLAWQLGFIVAVPLGGFLFLGFLVDKFFKTQPLFLIVGLLVGVIVTVYEVYHLLVPLIASVPRVISKEPEETSKESNIEKIRGKEKND